MKEELVELKLLREKLEDLRVDEEVLTNRYTETQEYKDYANTHAQIAEMKDKVSQLEQAIREEAVELSRQTGFEERKFGAVTIKEFTKVVILDQKQAVVWAAQNAPSCLTLTKDFDKAAKNLELPFVAVEKEYRAQIASDLSILDVEK